MTKHLTLLVTRIFPILLFIGLAFWSCEEEVEEDTTPPTVSISSHSSGQTVVNEMVIIVATTQDNEGISKVEFYIDDSLYYTDTEPPYEYEWNTTQYENNSEHILKVISYDNSDNSTESQPIMLIVDNSLPLFSVALNITDNDEARSVLHTIDGGYIILVSEIIDWNLFSSGYNPNRGSTFLVKTDSLGVQEWVIELDNNPAEDIQLNNSWLLLEQDIDGSYIIRFGSSSDEFNCIIVDATGTNQTVSYKSPESLLTSNDESYSYSVNTVINWNPVTIENRHSISKIGSMGDTLWTRDSIDSKLLAIDSNFSFGHVPHILTITDDNGFLLVTWYYFLSIAKFNSDGEIEKVTVEPHNTWTPLFGNAYQNFKSTNDGGYVFYGWALLKLNDDYEIEWSNYNPNSMSQYVLRSELALKETAENNYFLYGTEPVNNYSTVYDMDWDFSPPYITEIDNFGNVLSRKDFPQFRRRLVLDTTPDGGYVFSASYTLENGNVGLVLIKADSEGNILDFRN